MPRREQPAVFASRHILGDKRLKEGGKSGKGKKREKKRKEKKEKEGKKEKNKKKKKEERLKSVYSTYRHQTGLININYSIIITN